MTDSTLSVFAASGRETRRAALQRARRRLTRLGWDVVIDDSTRLRHLRFAGLDEERLDTLHRVADSAPSIAMACRGGYGMTRLLDAIDWGRIAKSVDRGTRWVGYSDLTAFQLGLLAHTGRSSWHGPMATADFGRQLGLDPEGDDRNEVTVQTFHEAMTGVLDAVGFRVGARWNGLTVDGVLWGGNLSMICSLLGTQHFPAVQGGILFLEDVAEHPYRVERMLLQLLQAGVLDRQRAVLLGRFTDWKPSPVDYGFGLRAAWARLASQCPVPLLEGLPVGHCDLNLSLPQGVRATLNVERGTAFLGFGHP